MKFCKDCKFHINALWCANPKNGVSPVTGKPQARWADVERDIRGNCGEDAAWFEPIEQKKPWWIFWK